MIPRKIINISLLISFFIFILFSVLNVTGIVSSIDFFSALSGFLLNLLNFFIGFLLLKKMKNQPFNKVFGLLVGGMLFRMAFMLILVFISLYFLELKAVSFIFSLLFFYIFYIVSEIFYLKSAKI